MDGDNPFAAFAAQIVVFELASLTEHAEELPIQQREALALAADAYLVEVARVRQVEAELERAELLLIDPGVPYEQGTHIRTFPGLPFHRGVPCACSSAQNHADMTARSPE